ncbi:hypothetical protein D3OALGA1CA_5037 [Olavius algarvensis associated proteobacterium Delta 3]|nr:hypothetical protein D3OALGA1CA_5037 [Olavius algarvensis associated proteobacterium Delta 3]
MVIFRRFEKRDNPGPAESGPRAFWANAQWLNPTALIRVQIVDAEHADFLLGCIHRCFRMAPTKYPATGGGTFEATEFVCNVTGILHFPGDRGNHKKL